MLSDYLNKQVGFIKINKPIIYTDRNYECAAWREERTSDLGVFPLLLIKKERYSNDFNVEASVPGIITDDYFPALWGGVAVSKEPYKPKYIGQKSRDIKVVSDLVTAVEKTGHTPDSDINWYINPKIWKDIILNREEELRNIYNELPKWWNDYTNGENEHHSKVRMIAYMGEKLTTYGREIEKLYRNLGYLEEKSDMWRNLHKQNTAWIEEYKA